MISLHDNRLYVIKKKEKKRIMTTIWFYLLCPFSLCTHVYPLIFNSVWGSSLYIIMVCELLDLLDRISIVMLLWILSYFWFCIQYWTIFNLLLCFLGLTAKVIDQTRTMADVYVAFNDFSSILKSKVRCF